MLWIVGSKIYQNTFLETDLYFYYNIKLKLFEYLKKKFYLLLQGLNGTTYI